MNPEILVWLIPAGIAVAAVREPRWGLLILAATLPLFGSPPGGPYQAAFDVALLAAIAGSRRCPAPGRSALRLPLAAFVVALAVSLLPLAYSPPSLRPAHLFWLAASLPGVESWSALYTWRAALDLALGVGVYLAVRRCFDQRTLPQLGGAIGLGVAASVGLGLLEHLQVIDLGGYRSWPTEPWLADRMDSLFFDSGWFAEYLVVAAPLGVAVLLSGRRWMRGAAVALAPLCAACLLLSQQRGGWLAGGVQLAFLAALVLRRREWRGGRTLAVCGAAAALAVLAVVAVSPGTRSSLAQRLDLREWSVAPRAALWRAAVEMTRQRPLSGAGLGAYAPTYDLLHPRGSEGAQTSRATAHNLYLHTAAEAGLVGLAALLLLVGVVARQLWGHVDQPLAAGLAVSLVGVAAYGLVQHMLYVKCVAILIWMILAAVSRLEVGDASAAARRASAVLILVALAATPVRWLIADGPELAGNRSFGFHEVERVGGAVSHVWVEPRALSRLPVEGETLVFRLANGHPLPAQRPVRVEVRVGEEVVFDAALSSGGWVEQRVAVDPDLDSVLVGIRAEPAFRPFSDFRRRPELARQQDPRLLAVAVGEPGWE